MKKFIENIFTVSKPLVWTAQLKAVVAILTLVIMGSGIYVIEYSTAKDPYTLDIQERSETVHNVVLGVIEAKATEPEHKVRSTCESADFIIKMEHLKAEQEALKLTPEQRALNVKYRAYLVTADAVVYDVHDGKPANLSAMTKARSFMGV